MSLSEPADCRECGSAGSVYRHFCEVCYAEVPNRARRMALLHPSIPLRFSDVIQELQRIARLATDDAGVSGSTVAAACRRAESLLTVLRMQFVNDIEVGTTPTAGGSSRQMRGQSSNERSSSVHQRASAGSAHPASVGVVDARSRKARAAAEAENQDSCWPRQR